MLMILFLGEIFTVFGNKVFVDRKRVRDLQMGLGKSSIIELLPGLLDDGFLGPPLLFLDLISKTIPQICDL